jgi:hypothetical protein
VRLAFLFTLSVTLAACTETPSYFPPCVDPYTPCDAGTDAPAPVDAPAEAALVDAPAEAALVDASAEAAPVDASAEAALVDAPAETAADAP